MRCPKCGREGIGNYCPWCGTPLGGVGRSCPECGTALKPGARYCAECGSPAAAAPGVEDEAAPGGRDAAPGGAPGAGRETAAPGARKPFSAYLPWILSGVALVAFAVAIGLFIQGQTAPRAPGMPPTGGLPEAGEGGDAAPPPGGMPSSAELAAMSPREAADRLFDRAMREQEAGDAERARFFADMGLQAYGRVPAEQIDADARFHMGLLHLAMGSLEAAGAAADTILASAPNHLLGLILAARVSAAQGRSAAADSLRARLIEAIRGGELERRPEYGPHRGFIEAEAGIEAETGGGGEPAAGSGEGRS